MPYIDSYMNTCLGKDQTAFRVQDTSKVEANVQDTM